VTLRIDISAWQHPDGVGIDFAALKAAGVDGAIIKASQGTWYTNPYFARDAEAAAAHGLEVDAYHFFDPQAAPAAQASFFHNAVGGHPLAYIADDCEMGPGDLTVQTLAFMVATEALFGLPPSRDLFYSYLAFFGGHLHPDPALATRGCWVADYGPTTPPPPPAPWPRIALWQNRSNGRFPGIVGDVDVDLGALQLRIAGALSTGGVHLAQPICAGVSLPGSATAAILVARDGGVFPVGGAPGLGSLGGMHLNQPVVGAAVTPTGRGYWLVASDGGVFPFGDALWHSYGSLVGHGLNRPVVGMAAMSDGEGYWLVAEDGGVFPFGDAVHHSYGSLGGQHLNEPVVGMVATPDGNGYWLVAADGGVFPFGSARGLGSLGGQHLNKPVVGMAATSTGQGYWLVAADGGVFTFGDAAGYGSVPGLQKDGKMGQLAAPVVGIAATSSGRGYWLMAADGGVFPFGDAAVPSLL